MVLRIGSFILVMVLVIAIFSCEKENEADEVGSTTQLVGTTNPPTNLGSSHNAGKNCQSCHKFTVAGSVYKKDLLSVYPGAIVKLTTQAGGAGSVVATFSSDKSGNLYTSSGISFGSGLYVGITGATGTKYMTSPITSGACNSCHGSSAAKAWTE